MGFKLKDIVLKGTKEELAEYNYNEMILRTCTEKDCSVHQIGPDVKHMYKTMAHATADMVIAMRPEVRDE